MVPGPDMAGEKEWGLLVTADDFGMCPERDRGILVAHRRGVVTSASLLVTGGSVASAVRAASEQGMQLGLHLNLSEGPPAAPQAQVASLLAPTRASWWPGEGEGTDRLEFRGKHGIREAAERGELSMEEVSIEVEAQLRAFHHLTGYFPLHLDGHQHVHVMPGISSIVARVARSFGVECVRIPHEEEGAFGGVEPASRRRFYDLISTQATEAMVVYRDEGLVWPAGFMGMGLMGKDCSLDGIGARMRSIMAAQRGEDSGEVCGTEGIDMSRGIVGGWRRRGMQRVCELMCHIGYRSDKGDDFNMCEGRESELKVLTSGCVEEFLGCMGVELVTVADSVTADKLAGGGRGGRGGCECAKKVEEGAVVGVGCVLDDEVLLLRYCNESSRGEMGDVGHKNNDRGIIGQDPEMSKAGPRNEVPGVGVGNGSGGEGVGEGGGDRLLILASTTGATGNRVTALRLADVASSLGWSVSCADIKDFDSSAPLLQKYITDGGYRFVLGVHAYRAGQLLVGISVPYAILLGGTDVNVMVSEPNKKKVMEDAMRGATCIMAFHHGMLSKLRSCFSYTGQCLLMPQAVSMPPLSTLQGRPGRPIPDIIACVPPGSRVFLLPCGLREVKDPTYLITAFREWHAEDSSVWLVIVGPVLSEECAADLHSAITGVSVETWCQESRRDEVGRGLAVDGVAYHPAVERDVLLAAMIGSRALLNSSTSEGMCNSLLEGMACGTPVVARAVPGNLELVRHMRTGLLFNSPRECISLCRRITSDEGLRSRITESAWAYIDLHHAPGKERSLLKSVIGESRVANGY